MVHYRLLIYIKPVFLVSILLIASNVVPADYIKSSPDEVASVESKERNGNLEKASSEYRPIPDWLSSVLNWLPTENRENGTAAFKDEDLDKDIEENFTSPKNRNVLLNDGNVLSLKDISPLYKSPKIYGEGIWVSTGAPVGGDGRPLAYKTLFRPSVEFPNTIVYLAIFDMNRLKPRLFIGRTEPVFTIFHIRNHRNLSQKSSPLPMQCGCKDTPEELERYSEAQLSIQWFQGWLLWSYTRMTRLMCLNGAMRFRCQRLKTLAN